MKKIIIAVLLITTITAAVFCQNGIIRELTGNVEIKRARAPDFVPASVGDLISPDTIVSTGFRSTAIIEIGSSVITVRPLTRLSLADIQTTETTEDVNINLQTGRIRVEVKPPAGTRANMTVQSPAVTASVRGTEYEFDTYNLTGKSGKVMLNGTAGPAVIIFGENSSFPNADGTISNPAVLAAQSTQTPPPAGTPAGGNVSQSADISDPELGIISNYK